jgi:hypothetical protein
MAWDLFASAASIAWITSLSVMGNVSLSYVDGLKG